MVPERNLVVAVFAGELDELGAALRAAPVAVEAMAFLEPAFHRHVLEVEWYLRVLRRHPLQEFPRGLVGEVALDMYRPDFAVRQELPHAGGEFHQEHARILPARNGNEHLVAVFNQVEVVERLGNLLADSFADCVCHVLLQKMKCGLKKGACSRDAPNLIYLQPNEP